MTVNCSGVTDGCLIIKLHLLKRKHYLFNNYIQQPTFHQQWWQSLWRRRQQSFPEWDSPLRPWSSWVVRPLRPLHLWPGPTKGTARSVSQPQPVL